jgi:serine/threonine protein kinase
VKLANFSICKRAENANGPSTVKGTLEFMALELLGFGNSAKDSEFYNHQATDMWALGEITYQMLTGERTFKDMRALDDYCRELQEHLSRRLMSFAGNDRAQFITALMAIDPHLRISATDAFYHP